MFIHIGGVAATLIAEDGVISPGGIGYDINCGVRLLSADMMADDLRPKLGRIGTLASGNHFLKAQEVDEIFDEKGAQAYGLVKGGVTRMIHCGSRGLGDQICTDYVRLMIATLSQLGYQLPDCELVCAPVKSKEGRDYFAAMIGGANFAWANRHVIASWVRDVWHREFGDAVQIITVYDVSHNIGKREWHNIAEKKVELMVHRKGATRAFGPYHVEVPFKYKNIGQPVLIPGTMGTSSYILAGVEEGMEQAFGTSCHGAGRRLSRSKVKKNGTRIRIKKRARITGYYHPL